jgi:hypothetical protein
MRVGSVSGVAVHPQCGHAAVPSSLEGVDVSVGSDLQRLLGPNFISVVRNGDEVVSEQDNVVSARGVLMHQEDGPGFNFVGGHCEQFVVKRAGEAEGHGHAAALPSSVRSRRT